MGLHTKPCKLLANVAGSGDNAIVLYPASTPGPPTYLFCASLIGHGNTAIEQLHNQHNGHWFDLINSAPFLPSSCQSDSGKIGKNLP